MKKKAKITPKFTVKTLLFILLGVLAFFLGCADFGHFSTPTRYKISRDIFYIVLGLGVFTLIQIAVGAFWKRARKWGLLAVGIGGIYTLIATMITLETLSPRPLLLLLGSVVVAFFAEIGIGLLLKKYERVMRIIGQVILALLVIYAAFMLGYSRVQNGEDALYSTLRDIRSTIILILRALTFGFIALGVWQKPLQKWGILALMAFLGITLTVSGQVGGYLIQLFHRFIATHDLFLYTLLTLVGLFLLEILVGLIWKPARKWGLLAISSGILFAFITTFICLDEGTFLPLLYMLLATAIAVFFEMRMGLLITKYQQKVHLFIKICPFLAVGFLTFFLGYNGFRDGGIYLLTVFRNARSLIFIILGNLFLGFILLGIFLKSARKWGLLAFLVFLAIITAVTGQVVDYVTRQDVAVYTGDVIGRAYGDKPIIYLYPTETTTVNVRVGKPENLVYTYPEYQQGWQVEATPDGTLTDPKTGRTYYALYWEGIIGHKKQKLEEGFVVSAEETIPFLEKKLKLLGLTEREANEFIVYWLPRLGENRYNFIRFQTMTEQNENMPLLVEPKPDTVIRIMMEYRGLNKEISVYEQTLTPAPARKGFTLVEWGGSAI